jgi:hypothetical protein
MYRKITVKFNSLQERGRVDQIEHRVGGLHHREDMVVVDIERLRVFALLDQVEAHMPPQMTRQSCAPLFTQMKGSVL